MAGPRKKEAATKTRRPPATTPEGRENQLISSAFELAEEQILSGTASSQVITHFLKLGSTRNRLEQDKLEQENNLLRAKIETLASAQRIEELYGKALESMREYSGAYTPDDDEDEYDR